MSQIEGASWQNPEEDIVLVRFLLLLQISELSNLRKAKVYFCLIALDVPGQNQLAPLLLDYDKAAPHGREHMVEQSQLHDQNVKEKTRKCLGASIIPQ
jgi:hypothetical protein